MKFIRVDEKMIDRDLSDGAFRLYVLLLSYCYGEKDYCFPSEKTLARRLNKSVRSVRRYICELTKKSVVSVNRDNLSNRYKVFERVKCEKVLKFNNYKKEKVDNFNNYTQRDYDFDKLEKKLLGWEE